MRKSQKVYNTYNIALNEAVERIFQKYLPTACRIGGWDDLGRVVAEIAAAGYYDLQAADKMAAFIPDDDDDTSSFIGSAAALAMSVLVHRATVATVKGRINCDNQFHAVLSAAVSFATLPDSINHEKLYGRGVPMNELTNKAIDSAHIEERTRQLDDMIQSALAFSPEEVAIPLVELNALRDSVQHLGDEPEETRPIVSPGPLSSNLLAHILAAMMAEAPVDKSADQDARKLRDS